MSAIDGQTKVDEAPPKAKSVATKILEEFFDTLEKEDDLGDIAPRLRKIVLEDGVFAEPSIRAAMFPDTPLFPVSTCGTEMGL